MIADGFTARARRALSKSPRYLAWRGAEAVRWRVQRPWSSLLPRLVTERALLRQAGARDVDALWTSLASRPFFLSPAERAAWARAFDREYPSARDRIVAD
ncbi:MAG TPA: hypothetical protein VG871_03755, partial [Vicinamibacterales bacterium]|nr:hypothetical protein [Vicinamibacterales bacterium]